MTSSLITQLRSYRIGRFAIIDFAASYIGFWLLWRYIPYIHKHISLRQMMASVIPVSILVHLVFRQYTPLTKMVISPTTTQDYIAVAITITCVIFMFI